MSGQPAAARSDYNAEAPRASALLKPVTSFPSSRAYWQSPPQGITTHCAVTRHLPKPTRRSYSAGRARRCRRAARCCAALAQPARAVRALWPHFSCRAKSARSTSATTDAPSAKAFPCAAKDRLSIRQKFALSISKGISQSYGLLGLSDRRHLPVDFRHPHRGAASAHGQKYRHRMAAPIVPR